MQHFCWKYDIFPLVVQVHATATAATACKESSQMHLCSLKAAQELCFLEQTLKLVVLKVRYYSNTQAVLPELKYFTSK